MNKTLKNILKYFVELIIVAFGVFLGVYFGNINADQKTKTEKKKYIALINKEIQLNKKLLEEHISYHESIKTEMDSIVPTLSEEEMYSNFTETKFKHFEIKGWRGLNFARLQKTAFETAKNSGLIKEFDVELLQKISDIYYLQDTYNDFGTSILNKAIGINSLMNMADFIGTIRLMTTDLLSLEKELLLKLESTLSDL